MDMLSVKEVANMLSVTPRTIQRWIADGKLVAYRLGERKIQIKKEDLEKFIESSRVNNDNKGE